MRMIRRRAVRAILWDADRREVLLIQARVPDTGAVLWFPRLAVQLLPAWVVVKA